MNRSQSSDLIYLQFLRCCAIFQYVFELSLHTAITFQIFLPFSHLLPRFIIITHQHLAAVTMTASARPGRFIVRLTPPQPKGQQTASFTESLDAILAFAAICVVLWYLTDDQGYVALSLSMQTVSAVATLLAIIIWLGNRGARGEEPSLAAVVDILPLGVQISTIAETSATDDDATCGPTTKFVGTPRFLPREDIVDAIVSEVVMGRSVESKVMFRVRTTGSSRSTNTGRSYMNSSTAQNGDAAITKEGKETHAAKLMREGDVCLVDAFPLVKLSHVQCLKLWEGIMQDLDKL